MAFNSSPLQLAPLRPSRQDTSAVVNWRLLFGAQSPLQRAYHVTPSCLSHALLYISVFTQTPVLIDIFPFMSTPSPAACSLCPGGRQVRGDIRTSGGWCGVGFQGFSPRGVPVYL